MEMNTRLEVEHPVTEAITGQDLVEWQFRVASGETLPFAQDKLAIAGCAIEARLYAENPSAGFLPATGAVKHLRLPLDVRVDSGIAQGDEVTAFYDPMIAKIIAYGPNRATAARRLTQACASIEVWPLKTNASFLTRTLASDAYLSGKVNTGFIEEQADQLLPPLEPPLAARQAAARSPLAAHPDDPWSALTGFRSNAEPDRTGPIRIAGTDCQAPLDGAPATATVASVDGEQVVFCQGGACPYSPPQSRSGKDAEVANDGATLSP